MFAIDGGRKYAYDEHVCVGLHDLEVGLELSKTIQTEFEPTISSQPVISQVNLSLHLKCIHGQISGNRDDTVSLLCNVWLWDRFWVKFDLGCFYLSEFELAHLKLDSVYFTMMLN